MPAAEVTVQAWPKGEPPCDAPGCRAVAEFSVPGCGNLCWDHMTPERDAGRPVFGLFKLGEGEAATDG